jgi:uncharacterized protein with GYD domain
MLLRAVLLIRALPTKEMIVGDTLKSFPEVKEVLVTYGEYDVVGFLEAPDSKSIAELVTKRVRHIEGVMKTATLLAID